MTNQASLKSEGPATRAPIFFWITVGLLAMLLLCGAAAALLLAPHIKSINRDGGGGWLLVGGIFVTATTLVCFACALCAAVSLLRREAHRPLSIALLIGSCLVVWAFKGPVIHLVKGLTEGVARLSNRFPRPATGAISGSTIPHSLIRHFQRRGIVLRPARYGDRNPEWILKNADVGARCEVVTSFVHFPSGTAVGAMKNELMAINMQSVLNEHARLAMFYPHARGTTSDKRDCEEWSVKSTGIVEQLLEAFKSYQPATVGDRPNSNR